MDESRWIKVLLTFDPKKTAWKRMTELFAVYLNLGILMTLGLYITLLGLPSLVGFSTSVSYFSLTVFFYSACFILFLVRAFHTAPILRKKINGVNIIQGIIGVVWIGVIVVFVRLFLLFFWSPSEFISTMNTLWGSTSWATISFSDFPKVFVAYILPVVLVSTVLEECLSIYCLSTHTRRKGTIPNNDSF